MLKLNDAGQSTEQLAGAGEVGGTIGVGEEAIVADAVSAKIAIAIVRNCP